MAALPALRGLLVEAGLDGRGSVLESRATAEDIAMLAEPNVDLCLLDVPDAGGIDSLLGAIRPCVSPTTPILALLPEGGSEQAVMDDDRVDVLTRTEATPRAVAAWVRQALRLRRAEAARAATQGETAKLRQLFSDTFQAFQEYLLVIDQNHRIVLGSWKDTDLTGREGEKCYKRFFGREKPCRDCSSRKVFETGEQRTMEVVEPESGRTREVVLSPIKDAGGRVVMVAQVYRDVTGRKQVEDALRLSRKRLQQVLAAAPVIIWTLDRDGTIVFNSGQDLDLLASHEDRHLGRSVFEVYADNADIMMYAMRALQGESVEAVVEHRGLAFELRYTPLFDEHGKPDGAVGAALDVTERVRAQRELDRAHAVLSAHVDNSPLAVIEWDEAFRVVRWSSRAEEMFGWEADEVLGRDPRHWRFVLEADQEAVARVMKDLLQGRVKHNMSRNRNLTRDGRVLVCEWRNSALFDEDGRLVSILSLVQDVSEEVTAQEELTAYQRDLEKMVEARTASLSEALKASEDSREKINTILNSVAEAIIVTDGDNRVVMVNPAAEALLDVQLDEVEGRHLRYAIRDESLREQLAENIQRAGAGSSYQFDFELFDPGRSARLILARTSVIQDSDGGQTGVVVSMRDITNERQVDRMKTEFISTAAHELRTPLTTIQGFSEVLLTHRDLPGEEVRDYLSYIHEQSLAVSNIVKDLLDISRIESGQGFTLNRQHRDLVPLFRRKASEYRARCREHDVRLELPEGPVEVLVDVDKLEQVLENLISNAVKYSPDGGRVAVSLRRREPYAVEVVVSDQGMGMTPEQVERIFEKFYRGDASNTNISGTGLGMSIVRHIVEAHNGRVSVESRPGAGTTIRVLLPVSWRLPEGLEDFARNSSAYQEYQNEKEAAP
jgi:PAS domain S-box-containing protein